MIFTYIILFIIILYIIYTIYFRLKHPFWCVQPVFHYHNLKHWYNPNKIIQNNFSKTKYYDPYNIEVLSLSTNISSLTRNQIYELIRDNYLCDKMNHYKPLFKDIYSYLECHIDPCFITYSKKYNYLFDTLNKKFIKYENINSCLTARPLYVSFKCNNLNKIDFLTYYVDFLCTDKRERKKGITPKVIYTFAYEMNKQNTTTFLFKREGEYTSFIPLTTYNCYVFDIFYWNKRKKQKITNNIVFSDSVSISFIRKDNFTLLERNLFDDIKNKFNYSILPSIIHIKQLINEKQIFVYIIHQKDNIIGYYIFRDTHTYFKNDLIIELTASLCVDNNHYHLFIKNMFDVVSALKQEIMFRYITIENTSDNNILLNSIKKNKKEIYLYKNSYYFYNYICYPKSSNECFILN